MIEERAKKTRKEVTDTNILDGLSEMSGNKAEVSKKSKGGIMVKGIHDVAVRFSRCCSPVPGDEIVGYVTRGRGVSIHRTDCVNIINLPSEERTRLIEPSGSSRRMTQAAKSVIPRKSRFTQTTALACL